MNCVYIVGARYCMSDRGRTEVKSDETYDFEVCARMTWEEAADAAIKFIENYEVNDDGDDPIETVYVSRVSLGTSWSGGSALRVYLGAVANEAEFKSKLKEAFQ